MESLGFLLDEKIIKKGPDAKNKNKNNNKKIKFCTRHFKQRFSTFCVSWSSFFFPCFFFFFFSFTERVHSFKKKKKILFHYLCAINVFCLNNKKNPKDLQILMQVTKQPCLFFLFFIFYYKSVKWFSSWRQNYFVNSILDLETV